MDRLDLELYAERLARHVERAADDLADARLRCAWAELERDVEQVLDPRDIDRLRALGVVLDRAVAEAAARSVRERAEDLAAMQRLQAVVECRRAGAVRRG